MRDIVATIQAHQDEAIRASARGVTEITGGPGTGKTVVALHRAAYLLYSERRRFESGGILVVGPSGAYTAYIERVLPSLGEESASRCGRSATSSTRCTPSASTRPPVARLKGSMRIRSVSRARGARARAGRTDRVPGHVAGRAVRLEAREPRPGPLAGAAPAPAQPRDGGRPG